MPHLSCISRDICELTPISDEFSSDLLGTGFFEAVSLLAGVMERGGCFFVSLHRACLFFFFFASFFSSRSILRMYLGAWWFLELGEIFATLELDLGLFCVISPKFVLKMH